jgi:hypothetical protein
MGQSQETAGASTPLRPERQFTEKMNDTGGWEPLALPK